jgi:multidrug efflux system membrane fusion protein
LPASAACGSQRNVIRRARNSRATRELKNAQALLDRGAGTAVRVVGTQAALARARALEAEARLALSNAEIRAPFAGVIDAFDLEPGENVAQGAEVGTVLDSDPPSVAVEVPLQSFADLSLGRTARVDFFATGLQAEGVLTFIGADASRESRTFPAEISMPNPNGAIPAGLSAGVWIATGESDADLIAAATLTLGADGALGVKAVDVADRVAFHAVTIERGESGGGLWVSGLPDIARIITIGQTSVLPGETVAPSPDVRTLAETPDQCWTTCARNWRPGTPATASRA